MAFIYLLRKEIIQLRRNAFVPRLIVLFPVVLMCVMPWVMNMELKNIVVDIVDHDHSTLSLRLVHRIEASKYFVFGGMKATYAEAMKDVEDSKADIVVEIPCHFERDMMRSENQKILVAANAVNGTKGSMGSSYMGNIITQHVVCNTFKQPTSPVSVLYLYNKHLNYKVFVIPSLMAILIMLMCGFLPALNIVSEKEKGTIETINVTPVRKWEFIVASLLDNRHICHNGMFCDCLAVVWHHIGGRYVHHLSFGHIVGLCLQWCWAGRVQLQ